MNRFELFSYLTAAVVGSGIAGYFGGLIAVLALFAGLGVVGFSEILVILQKADA